MLSECRAQEKIAIRMLCWCSGVVALPIRKDNVFDGGNGLFKMGMTLRWNTHVTRRRRPYNNDYVCLLVVTAVVQFVQCRILKTS